MTSSNIFRAIVLAMACALFAAPCRAADAIEIASGVRYEAIGGYDLARLDRIAGSELGDFMKTSTMPKAFDGKFPTAKYKVKLYRVTYPSVVPELNNRPTIASGLIAIPETGAAKMPIVSYQHGTVFDKSYVPSNPEASAETRIIIALFASQGYIVIGADYFGRGVSDLPDSYLVKASTQQANYDMLQASRAVLSTMNIQADKFFVSGWSQGGWATMVYLQKLESLGVKVTAAAAASAPVDVYLTVNRWLTNYKSVDAIYLPAVLALQLQAQEFYHQQGGLAAAAIRPEYLQAARDLYANRMDWETFYAKTKPKLADFAQADFIASASAGLAPYWRTLDANQAYRWKSVTPLRTYYGGHDEVTPVYVGQLPEKTQALVGGAPTQAIDAGADADHRAVFIHGVIDQKDWFDSFLAR